ncbi:precorrin-6y C5,15-methyltransferase (decarboxylating) subunit CbiE [Pilimelia anulata]|uniref:precorrin-6y C5,15-methyltransferase (decarboxylating) subunit CbiE n=1 Tax=Pilimelia anulata TaxID=53371 RepID=UPI00166B6473|nr:precorrin-6y C5,15-methyltransferase (decarboxylating) subunit CbiE [Pilimelia anulata]
MSAAEIIVVGIGADGWPGLPEPSRAALAAANVLLGGPRQLDLLPAAVPGERVPWPTPLLPAVPDLLARYGGRGLAVLASGDPMLYGIGATLARIAGPDRLRVLPHPSSTALAAARLGWPLDGVTVVSVCGRPLSLLHPAVQPGQRILVLSAAADTPGAAAALLVARGYGDSVLTALSRLGAADEHRATGTARAWAAAPPAVDDLHVLAVEAVAGPGAPLLPTTPGLPDAAYEHDGQLTKREIRAITLARLAPVPGQLLWDVGGGAGSIAIEWLRADPRCRAVAVERDPARAARLAGNAAALGVPGLRVVTGAAPAALADLPPPDAVFVGGGATEPGVLERCHAALRPGGRLVVNAVTMEAEALVLRWSERHGGDLTRIAVSRPAAVGGFTAWRPALPVTQWAVTA